MINADNHVQDDLALVSRFLFTSFI